MQFGKVIELTEEEARTFQGQPGQWVSVEGRRGRYIGQSQGQAWILWSTPYNGKSVQALRKTLERLETQRAKYKEERQTTAL